MSLDPGSLLPTDKSLLIIAGFAYVVGYFGAILIVPDSSPSAELWRRRIGALVSLAFGVTWLKGVLLDAKTWPVFPESTSLLDSGAAAGAGVLISSLIAWGFYGLGFGRVLWRVGLLVPPKGQDTGARLEAEDEYADTQGRIWGILLGGLYLGAWLFVRK